MLKLDGRNFSQRFTYSLWFLMSFQAGYINVGGFLIFGNFVSHVTGTSSQIGMVVANLDTVQLLTFVSILVAFISGAAFSGHMIGRKIEENKEPHYTLVTAIKSFLFGIVLILSEFHLDDPTIEIKLAIIFLLSFCCGVQNSTCSIATNGFLKPTHMTGLSTDIGIHLTKIFAWKNSDKNKFNTELLKNKLRLSILGFFIFGGAIALMIFSANGHYGFLFPFVSSLCLLIVSILADLKNKRKMVPYYSLAKSSIWGTFLLTVFLGFYQLIN